MVNSHSVVTIERGIASKSSERDVVVAAPKRKAGYYQPGLDALRWVAFLLVFTFHVLPKTLGPSISFMGALQEAGSAGVCIFFTLSAFLITELLLREQEASGTVNMKAFYIRRMLRIWPLYFLVLFLGVLVPFFYHPFPSALPVVLPYLGMVGNWVLVFQGETKNTLLAPLWSISVEEQFYLVWPTLFMFWGKRGIIVASFVIFPVAWTLDAILPTRGGSSGGLWCNSFSQFQFFALGGLLALITHGRLIGITNAKRSALVTISAVCLLLAATPCHFNQFTSLRPSHVLIGYLLVDVACVLLILATLGVGRSQLWSPFAYLGKISYGLYIFHMFIVGLIAHLAKRYGLLPQSWTTSLTWLIALAIVIPLAALSYRVWERPFLKLKDRFAIVKSRPA